MEDTVDMDIILLLTEIHTLVLTVLTVVSSQLREIQHLEPLLHAR